MEDIEKIVARHEQRIGMLETALRILLKDSKHDYNCAITGWTQEGMRMMNMKKDGYRMPPQPACNCRLAQVLALMEE